MDVVNRSVAVAAARWQSLPLGARLLVGLMAVVAVLSVAMLQSPAPAGPEMLLLGGEPLPPDQLPRVEAAFAKAGLSDYQIDAGRVRIPSQRNAAYMAALAAADALPQNFSEILDKPLRQSSPLMSRAQQEESIKIARQQALASMIQSMNGVRRAQVLYDRERKPGLAGGQNITASVTVTMQPGVELQPQQVEALRNLLTGAIAGLEPDNVAVIDLGSGRSFPLNQVAAAPPYRTTPPSEVAAGAPAKREMLDRGLQPLSPRTSGDQSTPLSVAATWPSAAKEAWAWGCQHARPLGFSGLTLASLVIVSAMARKRPARAASPGLSFEEVMDANPQPLEAMPATTTADPVQTELPQMAASTLKPEPRPGVEIERGAARVPVASDQARGGVGVDALVRDAPRTAATILQQWIGSAN